MNDIEKTINNTIDGIELGNNHNIEEAFTRLITDPGAMFEEKILAQLSIIRRTQPDEWQRIRLRLKKAHVQLIEIERLTKLSDKQNNDAYIQFVDEELWPEPVNGAQLLDDIVNLISLHIVTDLESIQAAALWIMFTWYIDCVDVAPLVNITAPERRCGKSEMLAVIGLLVYRPLLAANMGAAPMFRLVDKYCPTLLIDEVDTFLASHEDMRGLLNAGFTRSAAFVYRCVGDEHDVKPFSVWGAKALCGINGVDKLPTLADRSIPIRLRRKLPGECSKKVRHHDKQLVEVLRQKLARFSQDTKNLIQDYKPTEIVGLNDRVNDCWEPLFSIASTAGGHWPATAARVAMFLHGMDESEPTIAEQLLSSIKDVFDITHMDRISTFELLQELARDDELPWANWNRGAPMTAHQLAKRLSEFGIKSGTVRIGTKTCKGYKIEQFKESFERYIASPP